MEGRLSYHDVRYRRCDETEQLLQHDGSIGNDAFQGWDLDFYEAFESPYHQGSFLMPKHVSKMAGNMWNGFSYSMIWKVGLSLPLKQQKRYMNVVADERKLEQEDEEEEDDEDGDYSSD